MEAGPPNSSLSRRPGLRTWAPSRQMPRQMRQAMRLRNEDRNPRRGRLLRLARLPASERGWPRGPHRRQPVAPLDRYRARRAVAYADGLDPGTLPHLARGDGAADPLPPPRPRGRVRAAQGVARGAPAGRDRPSGRAAGGALFDEVRPPQGLHRPQQHGRDPQPPGRAGGDRDRRASGASGDDGRLRVFERRRADPGRLSRRSDRHARRSARAADPLPDAARLGLSHDQVARSDPIPVLRPERRPADHRPASGHRLGHPYRADPAPRPARQPVRLRRRITGRC